jgi:enamine deaminase RidA (YjgF/YER057c/UK114 family)
MRLKIFPWLGPGVRVALVGRQRQRHGEDETRELMTSFADHLTKLGLSLDDVVRTRMFARDMDAWLKATKSAGACSTAKRAP